MIKNNLSSCVYSVSIIIPTTCESARCKLLLRAIDSIFNQSGANFEIIIVVNGDRYDSQFVSNLECQPNLKLIRLEKANVSIARYVGVRHVTSDYFCFIDDDDEFLPEAFAIRLAVFDKVDADVVVTNGFIHADGKDNVVVTPEFAKQILKNPAESFLSRNWFGTASAFFRTKSFDPEIFNISFKYYEWTYLFFLILSKLKKIYFDEAVTYRKYEDNPMSISKTIEYIMAYPEFLLKLKCLPLEIYIKQIIHEKYITALNMQSNQEMQRGELGMAWKSHIKCLSHGGWRYFAYTRHLLRSTLWLS
jgi:glycosyltransferase involved in cell wall biosynthesis